MKKKQKRPGSVSFSESKHFPEIIKNLDLGPIKFKLLTDQTHLKWTKKFANIVEEEYRKFLTMTFENKGTVIVPDGTIDNFWHQHILDTQKYADDCETVFGRFIHHFPYFGLRDDDDQVKLQNEFTNTVKIYKEKFGNPPGKFWQIAADCGRTDCSAGSDDMHP